MCKCKNTSQHTVQIDLFDRIYDVMICLKCRMKKYRFEKIWKKTKR